MPAEELVEQEWEPQRGSSTEDSRGGRRQGLWGEEAHADVAEGAGVAVSELEQDLRPHLRASVLPEACAI